MYQVDQSAYWQAQLMNWGPKVLIAILILVATWIVARAVKWVLQKAIDRTPALRKHVTGTPEETVGHQLGTIAKLIIWLVGIMAALQLPRHRARSSRPINELVTEIFAFLPRLIGAGLIFFVGLIVARIVQRLVETVLIAANIDGLLARDRHRRHRRHACAPTRRRCRPGAAPGATRASLARARRRARLRADHHPGRDRRAAGARDRGDLRPGDRHAQPDLRRDPAHPRRGAVDRHRLHRRAVPEDDHRGDPAADRLRRCDPLDRRAAGQRRARRGSSPISR